MLRSRTYFQTRRTILITQRSLCSQSQERASSTFLSPLITISTRPRTNSRDNKPKCTTSYHVTHIRGAKKQATVSLDEIPQGPLGTGTQDVPLQDDEPSEQGYPPLLQQVRNNMLKFSHCVLLTRVGGFYEVGMCKLSAISLIISSCTLSTRTNLHRC
jgi:hypothetical protein